MSRYYIIFLAVFLPLVINSSLLAKTTSVAVLDFTSLKNETLAKSLRNRFETALCLSGKVKVIERKEFRFKMMYQNAGTYRSPGQAASVGRYIFADYVVYGSVNPVGNSFQLSVRLVDSETGMIIFSDTTIFSGNSFIKLSVDSLSSRILSSLVTKKETSGVAISPFSSEPTHHLKLSFAWALPVETFSSKARGGLLSMASYQFSHEFLGYGFSSGWYAFRSEDRYLYAWSIPLLADLYIGIPLKYLTLSTVFSTGTSFIKIRGKPGEFEYLLRTGLDIQFKIKDINLSTLFLYNMVIEVSSPINFFAFGIGTKFDL